MLEYLIRAFIISRPYSSRNINGDQTGKDGMVKHVPRAEKVMDAKL